MAETVEDVLIERREKEKQLEADFAEHFLAEIQRRDLIKTKAHEMGKKVIICDIDGTILEQVGSKVKSNSKEIYSKAKPIQDRIDYMNTLYDDGHYIIYWTSRGCASGTDYQQFTQEQLTTLGVRYSECITFKPHYDVWIDDKAVAVSDETDFVSSIQTKL